MPTVTVRQPTTINVRVGDKPVAVQSINYGARTLKSATDLRYEQAQSGDVISYDLANNSFVVVPANSVIPDLDAGYF